MRSGQGPIRCSCCRPRPARSIAGSTGCSTTIGPSSSRASIMSSPGIEERLSLSIQRPIYMPDLVNARLAAMRLRPMRSPRRHHAIACRRRASRSALGAAPGQGRRLRPIVPRATVSSEQRRTIHGNFHRAVCLVDGQYHRHAPLYLAQGRARGRGRARQRLLSRSGAAPRRWVIYRDARRAVADPAGLACLAASHRRCAADRGGLHAAARGRRRIAPI